MICGKCKNTVPDNFAFCPYCGQKVEAPAPEEKPVIARSAMPKEEEYAGRYETGDMTVPAIRFSKNLAPAQPEQPAESPKAPAPAQPVCAACGALLREGAKFCNICGQAVLKAEHPVEEEPTEPEKVEAPVQPQCVACGAPLREGAKFCNICGQAVMQAEPSKAEEPAAPVLPPVEQPAEPVKAEAPARPVCAACGAPLKEGAKFCNICGQAVTQVEPPKAQEPAAPVIPPMQQKPVQPVAEQKPLTQQPLTQQPLTQQPATPAQRPALKKCPLCGTVVDADARLCTGCGVAFRVQGAAQQQPVTPARQPAAPVKQKKKPAGKKSKAPLAIALVALIVVGALIAGFLTNWFGLAGGPLETVYNATEKTLRSGGFHVDFHISVNAAVDVDGSADCIIDIEEKELTALVELKAMGQTARIGVMDGVAVMQEPNGGVQTMEIGYILDEVFEAMEEEKSLDEALEMGVEMALEAAGMDDLVDGDKAVDCVDKSLNSASWLKKNAGYSTESKDGAKVHVFAPKLGDLVIAAVEALEPAFEDADELEEGLEYLEDTKSEMNDMADIEIALGVKGGKLVSISGEVSASGQDITAEVSFEDIGSAKVDTDEIEDMLDMVGTSDAAAAVEG